MKHLAESKKFWKEIVGMKEVSSSDHNAVLVYEHDHCQVELRQLAPGTALDRGEAFGRYAM